MTLNLIILMLAIGAAPPDGTGGPTSPPAPAGAPAAAPPKGAPLAAPVKPAAPPTGPGSVEAGNGAYSFLLKALLTDAGLVKYEKLGQASVTDALLEQTIQQYATAALPDDPRARLALWCNAYNANVLKMAADESRRPGFETLERVSGFFNERKIKVAGEEMTLDQLEKEKIRSIGDCRTHAALVCAAMSCPPLRREPYGIRKISETQDEAIRLLEEQLDDQCKKWINDPSKNGVVDGALELSQILDWYKADFEGKPYGDVIGFVKHYADPEGPIAALLKSNPKPEIRWRKYDWSLNRAPGSASSRPAPVKPAVPKEGDAVPAKPQAPDSPTSPAPSAPGGGKP